MDKFFQYVLFYIPFIGIFVGFVKIRTMSENAIVFYTTAIWQGVAIAFILFSFGL